MIILAIKGKIWNQKDPGNIKGMVKQKAAGLNTSCFLFVVLF